MIHLLDFLQNCDFFRKPYLSSRPKGEIWKTKHRKIKSVNPPPEAIGAVKMFPWLVLIFL